MIHLEQVEQAIPMVRSVARRFARRTPSLSEDDLEQEALLAMLRGRKSITGPMQDIQRREWMGSRRKNEKRVSLDELTGFRSSHERQAIVNIDLTRMLGKISARQREAVTLRYLVGMSQEELADELGVRKDAAANRVHQGMQNLRKGFK